MKTGIGVTILFIATIGLSWGVTCGIIKLITLCFNIDFSLAISTGIWLIMFLLKGLLSNKNRN